MKRTGSSRRWRSIRRELLRHSGFVCSSCGVGGSLEVHHRQPLSRGGSDDLENLKALCAGCHLRAHNYKRPTLAALAWRAATEELR